MSEPTVQIGLVSVMIRGLAEQACLSLSLSLSFCFSLSLSLLFSLALLPLTSFFSLSVSLLGGEPRSEGKYASGFVGDKTLSLLS